MLCEPGVEEGFHIRPGNVRGFEGDRQRQAGDGMVTGKGVGQFVAAQRELRPGLASRGGESGDVTVDQKARRGMLELLGAATSRATVERRPSAPTTSCMVFGALGVDHATDGVRPDKPHHAAVVQPSHPGTRGNPCGYERVQGLASHGEAVAELRRLLRRIDVRGSSTVE